MQENVDLPPCDQHSFSFPLFPHPKLVEEEHNPPFSPHSFPGFPLCTSRKRGNGGASRALDRTRRNGGNLSRDRNFDLEPATRESAERGKRVEVFVREGEKKTGCEKGKERATNDREEKSLRPKRGGERVRAAERVVRKRVKVFETEKERKGKRRAGASQRHKRDR
ncbi:unnamed protein product [Bursaphelenchus xylophilus]|uniref:(pine wood nematode) hypothetical protein n=1 Tax=Bursaphelenchus xylophilus TaxID=6326 RepID=A0A7I8XIL2_BURXY|nr:unnamed protein product [Bursaphelenchus xylophilus]CAG9125167.1 unnamed protein product [Bursaphelenchus xylophilus]